MYDGKTDYRRQSKWGYFQARLRAGHSRLLHTCPLRQWMAANLQLIRRDVVLGQLLLQDNHVARARTAPFSGPNLVGPNVKEFDAKIFTIMTARRQSNVLGTSGHDMVNICLVDYVYRYNKSFQWGSKYAQGLVVLNKINMDGTAHLWWGIP